MPSNALLAWKTVRVAKLDEIRSAHRAIGGDARGRRYATEQINQAYTMLLSSQFQAFCRELHSECIDHLARAAPPAIGMLLSADLKLHRKLDRGNPNSGNIGADFNRFGIRLWNEVIACEPHRNRWRQTMLDELCDWRNAIAHQDFDPLELPGGGALQLRIVTKWRKTCEKLAESFDRVMRDHLKLITGAAAW